MTRRRLLRPRLSALEPLCLLFVGAAVAFSVAARRAEPVFLAVGPLLALASSAIAETAPDLVEVDTRFERSRSLEGGSGRLDITVRLQGPAAPLAACLSLDVPEGVRVKDQSVRRFWLRAGRPVKCEFWLEAEQRGVYAIGGSVIKAIRPGSLRARETVLPASHTWEVLPKPVTSRKPPTAVRVTGILPGPHRSRRTGSGIEFAGLREYTTGDSLRDLDWRTSSRWRKWVIRQRHAAFSAETVVLLDALASKSSGPTSTFDACVRVAAGLVLSLLTEGNRVGLVIFGGVVTWVRPLLSRSQRWRLLRALRDAAPVPTYVPRDPAAVPRRVLPPNATVIAVSSLVDPSFADTLGSLKKRGWPVKLAYVAPGDALSARDATERLALRIQGLEHRISLDRLRERGIEVFAAKPSRPAPEWRPAGPSAGVRARTILLRLAHLIRHWVSEGPLFSALAGVTVLVGACRLIVAPPAPEGGAAHILASLGISFAAYVLIAMAGLAHGPGVSVVAPGPPDQALALGLTTVSLGRIAVAMAGCGAGILGVAAASSRWSGGLWVLLLALALLSGAVALVLDPKLVAPMAGPSGPVK